jgi:hypothetical protein
MSDKQKEGYAVIRIDFLVELTEGAIREEPDLFVTVKEVVPTQDEAQREVQRLNELNAEKSCIYFSQSTRVFPDGRGVQRGY